MESCWCGITTRLLPDLRVSMYWSVRRVRRSRVNTYLLSLRYCSHSLHLTGECGERRCKTVEMGDKILRFSIDSLYWEPWSVKGVRAYWTDIWPASQHKSGLGRSADTEKTEEELFNLTWYAVNAKKNHFYKAAHERIRRSTALRPCVGLKNQLRGLCSRAPLSTRAATVYLKLTANVKIYMKRCRKVHTGDWKINKCHSLRYTRRDMVRNGHLHSAVHVAELSILGN